MLLVFYLSHSGWFYVGKVSFPELGILDCFLQG